MLEARIVKFERKGSGRDKWISKDRRWFLARVERDNSYVWLITDLKTKLQYEKETLIEATRMCDRKIIHEAQQSTL